LHFGGNSATIQRLAHVAISACVQLCSAPPLEGAQHIAMNVSVCL